MVHHGATDQDVNRYLDDLRRKRPYLQATDTNNPRLANKMETTPPRTCRKDKNCSSARHGQPRRDVSEPSPGNERAGY